MHEFLSLSNRIWKVVDLGEVALAGVVSVVVTVRGVAHEGEEDHVNSEVVVVDLEVERGNTREEAAVIEGRKG